MAVGEPAGVRRVGCLMNILLIINGAAYGQDTTYNAVRLAKSLSIRDEAATQVMDALADWTIAADKVLVF